MITGFNTDIEHDGVVYHVQTEDKGLASPLILSLVYSGGTVLASKRSPYQDLIAAGFDEQVLSQRLKHQHRVICAAITAGRIEELKRMGARVETESEPAESVLEVPDIEDWLEVESFAERPELDIVVERLIVETASERPELEIVDRIVVETASERPETTVAAEPPAPELSSEAAADLFFEDEDLPKSQERSQERASAYTVYDPRRKAAKGAPEPSQSGLFLTILNEREFYAAETFAIRILLQNRSGKKEKPVSGVTLSLKILGTTFRPLIFSVKTGKDGIGVVSGRIPYFHAGRAAIVIHAVSDGVTAELRRVIHPAT